MADGKEVVVDNLTLVCEDVGYKIKEYPGWSISPVSHSTWVLECPKGIYCFWRNDAETCVRDLREWMREYVQMIEMERLRAEDRTNHSNKHQRCPSPFDDTLLDVG